MQEYYNFEQYCGNYIAEKHTLASKLFNHKVMEFPSMDS